MRGSLFFVVLTSSSIALHAQPSPGIQWVKALGGTGTNTVVRAVADAQGNLLIAGNTSSLDFPVTSAAQRTPGGSTLARVHTATGVSDKLYPGGTSAITSINADPRNPQTLYATAANAVWRSTDSGDTWSVRFQFASGTTVRFVAVDPTNGNILYAGTSPQGVFKSIDGGLTWTSMNNGISPDRDGSINVYRLFLDPNTPQVLFASATSGLWRTQDAGANWTMTVSSVYIQNTLVFDPFTPGTIYLSSGAIINRSTDEGKTWAPLSQLPDRSQLSTMIADPLHVGGLYAGSYSGIYESVDSGVTWTQRSRFATGLLAADRNSLALYANGAAYGILKSTDGFHTSTPIGPPDTSLQQVLVVGANVFLVASPTEDVFVIKLDGNGNVIYSTYFGGSADDSAVDMALGADGSVYVTGTTSSADFPVTAGAYSAAISGTSSTFLFKLNPDGSPGWSTYFGASGSSVHTIAVDAAGDVYIGGSSMGGLPTTAGAYQTEFQTKVFCGGISPCFGGPASAFVTKFNANGTALVYSTYVPTDNNKNVMQIARGLALDSSGNAYFGGDAYVVLLNSTGSAVLASAGYDGLAINALALDAHSNLYATGTWTSGVFPSTAGAFQAAPQPTLPALPAQVRAGGVSDAFVVKWDKSLSRLVAATLLGGESSDSGESIAIDLSGDVIVSGVTDSKAFPTRAPFQASFSSRAGFVAVLDPSLTQLLFSTYLGDDRAFDARSAVPDASGNILLAGSTLVNPGTLFEAGDPGASFLQGGLVVANKIAWTLAPTPRLDSVVNFASRLARPISPGEAIEAIGSGFGPDAQLVVDGMPLAGSSLLGVMPDGSKTSGAYRIQVSTGGILSNTVLMPAAPASPGIFSVDSSGYGQGYILNSDGTLNSASNPAAPGSAITILATGVGSYTLTGGYAVLAQPPAVFVDGFYANGIAAALTPVAGLPGSVYQISVTVPDPAKLVDQNPNLRNFKMPPQVGVQLVLGTVNALNPISSSQISQSGLVLNVKQWEVGQGSYAWQFDRRTSRRTPALVPL